MKKKAIVAMLSMLMGIGAAEAETSSFLSGQLRVEDDPRFGIEGVPLDTSIVGTIGNGVFTVGSPTPLFGANWTAHSGRVFGPGTYTFNVNKNNRGDLSGLPYEQVVVGEGQVGGHVLIDYLDFTDIDAIFVWDVIDNGDGTTTLRSVDAPSASPDNPDGLDGFLTREGPLANASANFDFTIITPDRPVTEIETPLQPYSTESVVLDEVSSVDEGVEFVREKLEREGFDITMVIDHARGAAQAGVIFPPNVIIIARMPRNIERKLLRRSKTVGIEMPMKFHVYEDEQGQVRLGTNSMGYIFDRHDVKTSDRAARMLDKFNEQFGKQEDRGLITIQSKRSFDDTVAALQEAILRVPGIRLPFVLDLGDGRKEHHGRKSGPVVIAFGNPDGATPLLIQVERRIGIDLPLKFLVWHGDDGEVNITTNDFRYIVDRNNLKGWDNYVEIVKRDVAGFMNFGAGISE